MQIDPHIAKCKRKLSSRLPRCLSNEEHDTPRISLFELFDGPSVIRQMQQPSSRRDAWAAGSLL